MAILKSDLLQALGSLSADEAASVGFIKVIDSPFKAPQSTPDRVKRVDGNEKWYQLQVVDVVCELHISSTGSVIHRYARKFTPVAPKYLLDGFEGTDTLEASDLTTADDPSIWSALTAAVTNSTGRRVIQKYK